MIVKFSKQEVQTCREFAEKIDTSFYSTRNQSNNDKRIKDQIVGKLSEIATFNFFKLKDVPLNGPDFAIYGKNKKSWDYDLKGNKHNFHVKGQALHQSQRYGESWIFQLQDKHIFKDVGPNDFVCFVIVDMDNNLADIKAVIQLQKLHDYDLFKKPKLSYLTSKAAVYFEDLKNIFKENLYDTNAF